MHGRVTSVNWTSRTIGGEVSGGGDSAGGVRGSDAVSIDNNSLFGKFVGIIGELFLD